MKSILTVAAAAMVGIVVILMIGTVFQGTWNIADWPEKARGLAGTACIIWVGFLIVTYDD